MHVIKRRDRNRAGKITNHKEPPCHMIPVFISHSAAVLWEMHCMRTVHIHPHTHTHLLLYVTSQSHTLFILSLTHACTSLFISLSKKSKLLEWSNCPMLFILWREFEITIMDYLPYTAVCGWHSSQATIGKRGLRCMVCVCGCVCSGLHCSIQTAMCLLKKYCNIKQSHTCSYIQP